MILNKQNYRLCILLFIFWMILTVDFGYANLLMGLCISVIVTILSSGILYDEYGFKVEFPKLLKIVVFLFRLMPEIYKSSFSYILKIIKKDCDPVFIDIDLNTNNPLIITIISNAITLTPGTLTVDTDKNKITVLCISNPEKKGSDLSEEIKNKYEKIFQERG